MSLCECSVDAARGIATLTFNQPETINAIDVPMARAFLDTTLRLKDDASVRCVVLRGAGRAFCAGGDLQGFAANLEEADTVAGSLLDPLHQAIEILRNIDAPVIAAVHGVVAGGGLSIVAGCDLVIAADHTRFVLAYDRIGAPPDCGASFFLPRTVGSRRAAQMMFTGEALGADVALAAGLVNWVVKLDQLEATANAHAERIAAGPTRAYGHFKRLVVRSHGSDLRTQLDFELASFRRATLTADFKEGITAFVGKRQPRFLGH